MVKDRSITSIPIQTDSLGICHNNITQWLLCIVKEAVTFPGGIWLIRCCSVLCSLLSTFFKAKRQMIVCFEGSSLFLLEFKFTFKFCWQLLAELGCQLDQAVTIVSSICLSHHKRSGNWIILGWVSSRSTHMDFVYPCTRVCQALVNCYACVTFEALQFVKWFRTAQNKSISTPANAPGFCAAALP